MASQSKISIVIDAQNKASKVIENFNSQLDTLSKKNKELSKGFEKVGIGMIAVGTGVGIVSKSFLTQAASFEQSQIAFTTMLGSAEKAEDMLKRLADFAAKTPFELAEVEKGAKALLAYGFSAKDTIPTLKALGDISAGLNVPMERLILNYGQVRVQTKLTGREMRDFAIAGVPLLDELAKNLGKSKVEIQEMISAGEIGFPVVQEAFQTMTTEGGRFNNLMDAQSKTFNGMMSNMRDSIDLFMREGGRPLVDIGKEIVGEIIEVIEKIGQWTKANPELTKVVALLSLKIIALSIAIGTLLIVVPKITSFFLLLVSAVRILTGVVAALLPYIATIIEGFIGLAKAINIAKFSVVGTLAPLALIIGAIVVLIKLVKHQIKTFDQFGRSLEVIANYLKKVLAKVFEYVSGKIKNLTRDLGILVKALGDAVEDSKITKLGEKIGASIEWGMEKAGFAIESTMSDIGYITNAASNKIQEGMSMAGDFIVSKWQGVSSSVLGSTDEILGEMGKTTEEMLADFRNSMGELEGTNTEALEKLSKGGEKIKSAWEKYNEGIRSITEKTRDSIEEITGTIKKLEEKLLDLRRDSTEKQKGFAMKYAEVYVDQEQKVADAQAEFNSAKDKDAKATALAKLQAEKEALESIKVYVNAYHEEVEFLEKRAALNSAQRRMREIKDEEKKAINAVVIKSNKIRDEIKLEEKKLTEVKKIQNIALREHDKFLALQELHSVDSINRQITKYNELARAIARAAAGRTSGLIGQAAGTIERATQKIAGYASEAGQALSDFISRPGMPPVPFSPQDTIIGVKNPAALGAGGITVNINGGTYLSEEAALDIGDSIIERLKNNFRI